MQPSEERSGFLFLLVVEIHSFATTSTSSSSLLSRFPSPHFKIHFHIHGFIDYTWQTTCGSWFFSCYS
jgi:hypothetical protein